VGGLPTAQVSEQDWESAAGVLGALSHPVRLRLLQRVLNGTAITAELAEDETLGTTGQLHHHLRRWSPRAGSPRPAEAGGAFPPDGSSRYWSSSRPPRDEETMTSSDIRPSGRPGITPRRLRALLVIALVFGVVFGTLLGLSVGPHTPALGDARTGDETLAADVRAALTNDHGYQTLSVGRVRAGTVTFAGLGEEHGAVPTPQTLFELGSITKTFTGMLLADAVTRKEMTLEDRLAQHLPELAGTPAGDITLFELATHSSGLPSIPPDLTFPVLAASAGNDNPYEVSVARVIEASRTVELKHPGKYAYSNLGMSLLGHAEARAAKVADWPTLATQRILQPLGMTATTFAATADDIPDGGLDAHMDNGWRAPYWYGPGFAPAGSGAWSTTEDLARFASAVLAKRAPGLAALESEAESDSGEIGLAWHIIEIEGREITWHNGATGGMRTLLGLDLERQQAVVVLGNTSRGVERVGLILTASDGPVEAVDSPGIPDIPTIVATLAGVWLLIIFARAAVRGEDRLRVATGLVAGAAGLLILLAHGPWVFVPAWVWGTLTGASVAFAGYAVLRSLGLPVWPRSTKGGDPLEPPKRHGSSTKGGDPHEPPKRYGFGKRRVLGVLNAVAYLIVLGCAIWSL
jgi:CubicO group peptidase (beta-lactamase class C family)